MRESVGESATLFSIGVGCMSSAAAIEKMIRIRERLNPREIKTLRAAAAPIKAVLEGSQNNNKEAVKALMTAIVKMDYRNKPLEERRQIILNFFYMIMERDVWQDFPFEVTIGDVLVSNDMVNCTKSVVLSTANKITTKIANGELGLERLAYKLDQLKIVLEEWKIEEAEQFEYEVSLNNKVIPLVAAYFTNELAGKSLKEVREFIQNLILSSKSQDTERLRAFFEVATSEEKYVFVQIACGPERYMMFNQYNKRAFALRNLIWRYGLSHEVGLYYAFSKDGTRRIFIVGFGRESSTAFPERLRQEYIPVSVSHTHPEHNRMGNVLPSTEVRYKKGMISGDLAGQLALLKKIENMMPGQTFDLVRSQGKPLGISTYVMRSAEGGRSLDIYTSLTGAGTHHSLYEYYVAREDIVKFCRKEKIAVKFYRISSKLVYQNKVPPPSKTEKRNPVYISGPGKIEKDIFCNAAWNENDWEKVHDFPDSHIRWMSVILSVCLYSVWFTTERMSSDQRIQDLAFIIFGMGLIRMISDNKNSPSLLAAEHLYELMVSDIKARLTSR